VRGETVRSKGRGNVLVEQLALPHYRQGLVERLAETTGSEVVFLTGDAQFYAGVVRGVGGPNVEYTGPNVFFAGRRLAYQRVPAMRSLRAGLLVIELNPRIVNSWVLLAARRLLGRPTWAWGHVFARVGKGARTEPVRNVMRRALDGMVVYTEVEAAELHELNPGLQSLVAYNAVYRRAQLQPLGQTPDPQDFIVIGRLVADKKPGLAVEAMRTFSVRHPESTLLVVGKGPLDEELRAGAEDLVESGSVQFLGEVTEWADVRELFDRAVALVAPGYVGLNVTQALGFGVPVIYAEREPHAPESEALTPENSYLFESDDPSSLASAMERAWDARIETRRRAEQIAERVRSTYAVEAMASAFEELAKRYAPASRGETTERSGAAALRVRSR
jgi:glycosyltransferase involved in cell wall biosynthesis